jgi:hypothetical protein
MEQREQSQTRLSYAESRQRKTIVNRWSSESHVSLLRHGRVVTEVGKANTYGAWGSQRAKKTTNHIKIKEQMTDEKNI